MSHSTSIIPGSTVDQRFTVIRPLGKGSMGSVWLARHLALDIDVAIKFIDSSLTREANYVERFRREARAAAQLKSPHVVQVLDYGTDQYDRPFMAMEYLQGLTLGRLLEEHPQLPLTTTARIITHATRGLRKAHALGITHRDIKPENLFLCGECDEEGFILKVLDFGVARAGFAASAHSTLAGQLVGSPAYMSPEQARGYRTIDHRADLFALGVVAYQCVTGKMPFSGHGLGELLVAICEGEAEPPSRLVGTSPGLDAWFEKALAKDPHQRFGSAREMGIAFNDALGLDPSSDVDLTSSCSRVSLDGLVELAAPSFGHHTSEGEVTRAAPLGTAHSMSKTPLSTSRIQPTTIADALAPLSGVPHTLGIALLDHNDDCLLVRGKEQNAASYTSISQLARTIRETVESIEGATNPTHLSVRFDNATVYVRWVGPFSLIVRGQAQMRALLLTVGSNKLADRLSAFMAQLGGVEPVANLLRDSGVGMPLPPPPTPGRKAEEEEEEVEKSSPGGPTSRDNWGWRDQDQEHPVRGSWGLGKRAARPAGKLNRTPTVPRSPAAKRKERETLPSLTPPAASAPAAFTDSQPKKDRVRVYRGQVVGGPPAAPPDTPKKKVRVYRGRVIDEK